MGKKHAHVAEPDVMETDEKVEELIESYKEDVYDILMDAYEKIADKMHDLAEDVYGAVGEDYEGDYDDDDHV